MQVTVGFTLVSLSAVLPLDDGTLERTPPSSSGGEGEGGDGEVMLVYCTPSAPVTALAPSLTPASQPTISLLTDNNADTLSVESLTLLPPADSPHLHPCTSNIPATHGLQRPDTSILEEEEEDDAEKGAPRDREELLMDETETEATIKEENTTRDLIKHIDKVSEEPEEEETLVEVNRDEELQERDDSTATRCAEKTEEAEIRSETPDSPELD